MISKNNLFSVDVCPDVMRNDYEIAFFPLRFKWAERERNKRSVKQSHNVYVSVDCIKYAGIVSN